MSVEIGKDGRIVLPKEIRERYGVAEKTRLIIRERGADIVLTPVRTYDSPTEALFGSVKVAEPVDDPKGLARSHIRVRAGVGEK